MRVTCLFTFDFDSICFTLLIQFNFTRAFKHVNVDVNHAANDRPLFKNCSPKVLIYLFVLLFVDILVLSKMWKGNEYEDGILRGHLQQTAEIPG